MTKRFVKYLFNENKELCQSLANNAGDLTGIYRAINILGRYRDFIKNTEVLLTAPLQIPEDKINETVGILEVLASFVLATSITLSSKMPYEEHELNKDVDNVKH